MAGDRLPNPAVLLYFSLLRVAGKFVSYRLHESTLAMAMTLWDPSLRSPEMSDEMNS